MPVAEWLRLWTLSEVDVQARSPLLLVDPPSSCCGHLLLTAPRCSSFHSIALGYPKLLTWEAIASPPPTHNNWPQEYKRPACCLKWETTLTLFTLQSSLQDPAETASLFRFFCYPVLLPSFSLSWQHSFNKASASEHLSKSASREVPILNLGFFVCKWGLE